MSEIKLLPCPFCGGEVVFVKTGCSSRGKIGHLYCDGCKEKFFNNDKWYTETDLYEKWNTRKPMQEQSQNFTNEYMLKAKLQEICERLEEKAEQLLETYIEDNESIDLCLHIAFKNAISYVKEVGGMNET